MSDEAYFLDVIWQALVTGECWFEPHVYQHSCVTFITDHQFTPVILLMEIFILQLCTSLRSTSRSSLDFCRHTVFDYSNRLIGLQEALTQIPRQLPAGDERAERTPTFSAHKHPTGSAWIITPK